MKSTDTNQFMDELRAGVFSGQVGRALSEVAAGVTDHGGEGDVTIKFKIKQIGQSQQINVLHSMTYVAPTSTGNKSETVKGETPMHVNPDNEITLFPKNQGQLFEKS